MNFVILGFNFSRKQRREKVLPRPTPGGEYSNPWILLQIVKPSLHFFHILCQKCIFFGYPLIKIQVKVTLVRSHSKKLDPAQGYKRFVDKATSFDFIKYGSMDTYELSFRVVRFPLSDSSYECIVTNLPADEFPPERMKKPYFSRWGIESSFRKLKYTIGLSNFHAYKPEYVKQEIWAWPHISVESFSAQQRRKTRSM